MRAILIIAALLYSQDATTELNVVKLGDGLPQFIGAPCSLESDYINGKCVTFEVRRKPRIRK